MKVRRKLAIIAVLFLILNMIIATQYAITKLDYEFTIVHPCNSSMRYIGSDNASDGERVLRIAGSNVTNVRLVLNLGNIFTTNMVKTYTAAFGIVNEESYSLNITHINVSSSNFTYMKIYLHGNRTANCINLSNDPSAVYMWNNNTMMNSSNSTAWTLAAGNNDTSDMCHNISDRANNSITTPWDDTSNVRYSVNNSVAESGVSDYVWVQVSLDIPSTVKVIGTYTGTIWIHLESEAGS